MKAGEESICSRSTPRGKPGKLPGFDFLRRITATLLKLNSLDALIPAREYREILRSSEWLLRERERDQFYRGRKPQKLDKNRTNGIDKILYLLLLGR